jgi:hypothetical protein
MPVETIKCRECGSGEVTEFKPGSYVCGHCEAIFKHVDPARATVDRDFCECGGAIAFRCRVCHTGICAGHDAWRAHQARWNCDSWTAKGPWIPSTVPAYRLDDDTTKQWPDTWRSEYYVVTASNRNRDLVHGQFDGGELHLCRGCLLEVFLPRRMVRTTRMRNGR